MVTAAPARCTCSLNYPVHETVTDNTLPTVARLIEEWTIRAGSHFDTQAKVRAG